MSALLILYLLGLCIALLVLFAVRQYYAFNYGAYSKIASFPVNLIFGHALQLPRNNTELWAVLLSWYRKYSRDGLFTYWLLDTPVVNMANPAHLEALLGSSDPDLLVKDEIYTFLHPWLKQGLLTSLPKKWFGRRKLLTPSFHFNILQEFLPIFNEFAEEFADKMEKLGCTEPVDVFPYAKHCALGIITETAMGKRFDENNSVDTEYIDSISLAMRMVLMRHKQPWFKSDFMYNWFGDGREFNRVVNIMREYTYDIIKRRMLAQGSGEGMSTAPKRLAFLDTLLTATTSDGQPLTVEDIREEVDTFMFEGHDTVSSGLSWATFLMALHQDEQKKVHAELDEIFGSSTRAATADDLRSMKYLECAVKESMRVYPPVPFLARRLRCDLHLDGGKYVLPKDARVFFYPYFVHSDPAYYPDPDRFDPDRFSEKNSIGRHPYAYIPFSAGPRNCIGQKFAMMEMKVVLSALLRRFTLTTKLKPGDVPPCAEAITRTEQPMLIKFNIRDHE